MATLQNVDKPFTISLTKVTLTKFSGGQNINLLPQLVEVNIYQSLFEPVLQADILINDAIGILENFPMLGEETIEFSFKPSADMQATQGGGDARASASVIQTLTFVVNTVKQISPDHKGRSQSYVLECYSIEHRENSRKRIQRAFNTTYTKAIEQILEQELVFDKKKIDNSANNRFEETKGTFHFIIPNMRPLRALNWMTKRAVPVNSKANLMFFYETFDGFWFKSMENLIQDGNLYFDQAYPDSVETGYDRKKFIYMSNATEAMKAAAAKNYKIRDSNFITAIAVNKRWNTNEKALAGYYENEYFDIDILNKKVISTKNALAEQLDGSLSKHNMNTPQFIKKMQNINDSGSGVKNRVRYVISQNEGEQADEPTFWKDKFGEAAKRFTAMSQVSVTAVASGDTRLAVGEVIDIIIPNMTGYNRLERDRYIAGRYIVMKVKHTISVGNKYAMTMELHRDSYDNDLNRYLQMEFNKNGR